MYSLDVNWLSHRAHGLTKGFCFILTVCLLNRSRRNSILLKLASWYRYLYMWSLPTIPEALVNLSLVWTQTNSLNTDSLVLFYLFFSHSLHLRNYLENKYVSMICGFFPLLHLCPSFLILWSLLSEGLLPFLSFSNSECAPTQVSFPHPVLKWSQWNGK